MASNKVDWGASAAFSITLASLATDAGLLTGRSGAAIDNTVNKYKDYLIGGKITTGTSPTDKKQIEVLAYASLNDTPLYPDTLTGLDAGKTLTNAGNKLGSVVGIVTIPTTNADNVAYFFGPYSIARLFGFMPKYFALFIAHNTGVNLNATAGNHAIYYTGCYETLSG